MYTYKFDDSEREIELHIVQKDITTMKVDAIVNAAHERLMGGGGVDGAIHRAAGPKLAQECRAIPEVSRGCRCPVGDAHITAGYYLPAKHVIHTVAPKFAGSITKPSDEIMEDLSMWSSMRELYKDATEGTDEDLARCYANCIKLAGENNIESIAFSSLGTGGHAIPIEIASPIAIKSVMDNLKHASSIKQVYFVCFSNKDFDLYTQVMEDIT